MEENTKNTIVDWLRVLVGALGLGLALGLLVGLVAGLANGQTLPCEAGQIYEKAGTGQAFYCWDGKWVEVSKKWAEAQTQTREVEEKKPEPRTPDQIAKAMTSFAWDFNRCTLLWTVEKEKGSAEWYEIDLHKGVMSRLTKDMRVLETRKIPAEELEVVHKFMGEALTKKVGGYLLESTVWWEDGEGEVVPGPKVAVQ